jgi:hypothetical protein
VLDGVMFPWFDKPAVLQNCALTTNVSTLNKISNFVFFSSKYFTFVYTGIFLRDYEIATNLIQSHQILLHGLYFYFLFTNLHINNRELYRSHLLKLPRIFIMLAHIFFWYLATNSENIFLLYLVDMFLPFYWHTHMRILTQINEQLDS